MIDCTMASVLGLGPCLGLEAKFCSLAFAVGRPWPCHRGLVLRELELTKKFKANIIADWPTKFTFYVR